ncbi:MAG: N-acetylglutamate synthase-like GNAT family acetyltransferase [Verrucomicrobiales bacterium]|jgi:N-acetylglutamate synthase-like GNAT family acetyltransferase
MLQGLMRSDDFEGVSIRQFEEADFDFVSDAIRKIGEADFDFVSDAIRKIGEGVLGKGLKAWEEAYLIPNGVTWTAEFHNTPVGFAATQDYGNGCMILHSDIVHPSRQRCGIGTALVLVRLATSDPDEISELGLLATEHSRTFYQRFGFKLETEPTIDPFSKVTLARLTLPFNQTLSDDAWNRLTNSRIDLTLEDRPNPEANKAQEGSRE